MHIDMVNILLVIAILAIIVLVLLLLTQNNEGKRLTPLAGLAFGFIIAGVGFGENRTLGYGLFGTGIILAIIDIIIKYRKNKEGN
jgi:preprotein translocase subunit SecG